MAKSNFYNEYMERMDKMVQSDLEKIEQMELGSQERLRAVETVDKLQKMRLDRNRLADEQAESHLKADREFSDKRKDRIIKIILSLIEIGAPLALYGTYLSRGFKFEEEGTYTSSTFRSLIGKLGSKLK